MNLPEPSLLGVDLLGKSIYGYTPDQVREILEIAAKTCEDHLKWPSLGPKDCAHAIRELKGEVK